MILPPLPLSQKQKTKTPYQQRKQLKVKVKGIEKTKRPVYKKSLESPPKISRISGPVVPI